MAESQRAPSAYTLEQAARLSGASEGQLRSWARDGFYGPEHERAELYSFVDLVALSTLHELRNRRKIPLQHLRSFGRWLRKHMAVDNPWASLRFRTDGRELVVLDARGHTRWVSSKPAGQLAITDEFDLPFEDVVRRVRSAAMQLRERTVVGKTERRRGVLGKSAVVVGTRIPVRAIKEYDAAGYTTRQILDEYPELTEADVKAALAAEEEGSAA